MQAADTVAILITANHSPQCAKRRARVELSAQQNCACCVQVLLVQWRMQLVAAAE